MHVHGLCRQLIGRDESPRAIVLYGGGSEDATAVSHFSDIIQLVFVLRDYVKTKSVSM